MQNLVRRAEIDRLLKDVNEILGYFETIRSLQLDVGPMTYVSSVNEPLREDEPAETLSARFTPVFLSLSKSLNVFNTLFLASILNNF